MHCFDAGKQTTGYGGSAPAPSSRSIRKILDFALAYEVMESEMTGEIEMNLN